MSHHSTNRLLSSVVFVTRDHQCSHKIGPQQGRQTRELIRIQLDEWFSIFFASINILPCKSNEWVSTWYISVLFNINFNVHQKRPPSSSHHRVWPYLSFGAKQNFVLNICLFGWVWRQAWISSKPIVFFFYTFGSLCNYISIVLLSIESFVFVYMCRVSVSNWCACRNKNKSFHSVYSPRMLPFSIIYVEISVRCTWKGRKCHWQRLNNGEMPWKCKVLRGSVKPSLVILKFQLMLSWNINSRHFCVWEAFSCHCAFQQQMLAYWLSNHIKWGYLRPNNIMSFA